MMASRALMAAALLSACSRGDAPAAAAPAASSGAKPVQALAAAPTQLRESPEPGAAAAEGGAAMANAATAEQVANLRKRARAALEVGQPVEALHAYEQACSSADLGSCVALAALLESGRGGREDPARASALYRQACAGGMQQACDQLGH